MQNYMSETSIIFMHYTVADPGFDLRVDFVKGGGGKKIIESIEGWSKSHFSAFLTIFLLKLFLKSIAGCAPLDPLVLHNDTLTLKLMLFEEYIIFFGISSIQYV